MNKEKLKKYLIFVAVIFIAFISLLFIITSFWSYVTFFIVLLLCGIILLLLEIYLRIQHHLDDIRLKFNKTQEMDNKILQSLNYLESITKKIGDFSLKESDKLESVQYVQRDILKTLLKEKLEKELYKKDDITVIIGTRDRYDNKIVNLLKSLRNQDYPRNLIKILLVDYGSKKELIKKYKKLCKNFKVRYIRVSDAPEWNQSKCMNFGVKNADTKYVLITDEDLIFQKNYISESIKHLKEEPYQIIYCRERFSSKDQIPDKVDINKEYFKILSQTTKRAHYTDGIFEFNVGMSKVLGLRALFLLFGGYDENFRLWGCCDDDLIKRFSTSGVKITDLSNYTSHIHQWHEHYAGVSKEKDFDKILLKNKEHLKKNKPIFINNLKYNGK